MTYKPNESRTVSREKFARELDLQTVFSVLDDNRIVEEMQAKRSLFSPSQFSSLERAENYAYEIFIENYRNKLKLFNNAKKHRRSYWFRFACRFLFQKKYREAITKFNQEMQEIERLASMSKSDFIKERLSTQRLSDNLSVKQLLPLGTSVFLLTAHDFLRTGNLNIIQDEVIDLNIVNTTIEANKENTIMVQYQTKLGNAFDFERKEELSHGEWPSSSAKYRFFSNFEDAKSAALMLLKNSHLVFVNNEENEQADPFEAASGS